MGKFYIYDNGSEDDLRAALAPYARCGVAELTPQPGAAQQRRAYQDAVRRACARTFWLALIDIDEFLMPLAPDCGTVPEILRGFMDKPALCANWMLCGSGGQKSKADGLVIERFRQRAEEGFPVNRHVKAIVNPRKTLFCGIHCPEAFFGRAAPVYTDGAPLPKNRNGYADAFTKHEGRFSGLVINHYFTKSLEEFEAKRRCGSADRRGVLRKPGEFGIHDRNEVADMAMDRYIPRVKAALRARAAAD